MSFINQVLVTPALAAAKAEQSGVANLIAATDGAIQKWVDVMILRAKTGKKEFMKGNARTNEARKEIGDLFAKLAPVAGWQESAVRNYQTSFWMAFETGKPYQRSSYLNRKPGGASRGAQHDKGATINDETIVADLVRLANHLFALDRDGEVKSLQAWAKKAGFEFVIEADAE